MPFIQNLKIPKKQKKILYQTNFNKGLNNITSSFELSDLASPDLLNVLIDDGSVQSRPGTIKYLGTLLDYEYKNMYIYQKDVSSVKEIILINDTKISSLNLTTGVETLLLTTTDKASGFQYINSFYFICPEGYFEYDGTDLTKIIDQGDFEFHYASAGGANTVTITDGNASDDYYNGWYVYIGEGTGVDQIREITDYDGTTKVATVASNWVTNPDATSYLYLSEFEQGELTTGNDGTYDTKLYTPSYSEYTDTSYGENLVSKLTLFKNFTFHRNSFFASYSDNATEQNRLRFNKLDNIYYFPNNAWLNPNTGDDDVILGTYSFSDVLAIFKKHSVFALYGLDVVDFDLKQISASTGTVNIDTVTKVKNYLYYFGSDGIIYSLYDLRTDYRKLLTKPITEEYLNMDLYPVNVYKNEYSDSRAIYFDNKYILAVSDKVFILDMNYESIVMWDNINPTAFVEVDDDLVFTNSNKYVYRLPFKRYLITEEFTATSAPSQEFSVSLGYIGETETGTDETHVYVNGVEKSFEKIDNQTFTVTDSYINGDTIKITYLSMLHDGDDGVSYESYYKTKDYDLGYPTRNKRIREYSILAETFKYYDSTLDAIVYIDFDEFDTGFTMENQISLWGISVFGDKFIKTNIVQSEDIKINRRGRIFSFKFSNNNLNEPWKIYGVYSEVIILKK